jgi:hypothetical protein
MKPEQSVWCLPLLMRSSTPFLPRLEAQPAATEWPRQFLSAWQEAVNRIWPWCHSPARPAQADPKAPENRYSYHEGAKMMRVQLTALLAAAGFLTIDYAPAFAQNGVSQYPFCIQGMDNPGWSGCSFNTLASCQASASGLEAECLTNPWYRSSSSVAAPSQQGPSGMGGQPPIGRPSR